MTKRHGETSPFTSEGCCRPRLSSPVCLVPLRQTVQGDWDHGLQRSIQNLHILAGIFSLDILYLKGKSPLLLSNIQVNLMDILLETSTSSTFSDMCVNSHLKLLLLFSPDKAPTSRTAWVYCRPLKLVGEVTSYCWCSAAQLWWFSSA